MNSNLDKLINDLTNAIKKTTQYSKAVLHEPDINNDDINSVIKTLKSGYVSSVGPTIDDFEKSLCKYTNANYAVAMSNGTSCLHIALLANGI